MDETIPATGKYNVHTLQDLQKFAEEHGCELFTHPMALLLDIDKKDQTIDVDLLHLVHEKFGVPLVLSDEDMWTSRGGNLHVVLNWEPERFPTVTDTPEMDQRIWPIVRFALQAILGSDPKREAIALHDFLVSGEDTNSLFKPKKEA